MQKFTEINLSTLRGKLEQNIFGVELQEKFIFLPITLYQAALRLHLKTHITDIKNWERFETDHIDFDSDDFESMLSIQHSTLLQSIYFVSDETIKLNLAYKFELKDFSVFVSFYEDKFKMEFFQPADYIIVFENPWKIGMIYHEGKVITVYPLLVN